VLCGAMAFFLLSLIGIPFTGGFFAKFYVFSAALQQGMFGLAIIGFINSGIAAFYYLRLLTVLYSKPAEGSPVLAVPGMSITLGIAILLAASATLLLGVVPRSSLDLAQRGAGALLQTGHPAQAEVQISNHTPSQ
jgi:NADH-quinone oxidoreductase subunit N